jgi:prolyl-tRNA synthetase
MKLTDFFIPTLREEPQDAEIDSHKLMLKAGLIRKVASGIYSYLPLGLRSLKKIEQIIREEMNNSGAIELLFPAIMPRELWEETGRWEIYGEEMFKIKDRKEREFCLGPTHEEAVVDLARNELQSYKEIPKTFFQIQTKYRDEIRPRFGLMRAKEFIMKDAYSFDESDEKLEISYKKMFDAYVRIFKRCGLNAIPIEADSGAIGGKISHEFVVKSELGGESEFVYCPQCNYAANVEAAKSYEENDVEKESEKKLELVETFQSKTIEEVSAFLNIERLKLGKSLLYKLDDGFVLAVVRGDDEINEIKLKNLFSSKTIEPANDDEVFACMGAHTGAIGPVGAKVRIVIDRRITLMKNFVTGANRDGFHYLNVNHERDFKPEIVSDIRQVKGGERCPRCGSVLEVYNGIEVGHTFKLGTKYSESMKATFLDSEGKQRFYTMGCYGIGVGRTMQSVIEQYHDEKGIIWPSTVAPFHVEILPLNMSDKFITEASSEIYEELKSIGLEALIDNRIDASPGEKFNDADLIGAPLQVIIGKSFKDEGKYEIKIRKTLKKVKLEKEEAKKFIKEYITKEIEELNN